MSRLRPEDAARRQAGGPGREGSEALARGLAILATFNATTRSLTLSEVARTVDLPRATARRALLTLVAMGYVAADGRQFRLTARVLRLAASYLTSNGISSLLQAACERVAAHTGQSCTAAVLDRDEVVMIARALPAQALAVGAGIGYRLPAYCSALGRVLLSDLADDALAAHLARATLAPHTPHTETDPARIAAAVRAVHGSGFCYVAQEAEFGFHSVAVPLRRFDGRLVAALNVGARVEAAPPATMTGPYREILTGEAAELSFNLV